MTVCIAALFDWDYGQGQIGRAIITASDRMMTAGNLEYEPLQHKVCFLRPTVLALVAGDMTVHSEALSHVGRALGPASGHDVETIANMFGQAIADCRRKRAAKDYLDPLGLNEMTFLREQKTMDPQLVLELTSQMQSYSPDVEALVVGCDGLVGRIFHIRDDGLVTCHDDINFAAIGIGREHAKSQFMFLRYPRIIGYGRALPILYVAKKRAEAAPGVGKETDYFLVTQHGWSFIEPRMIAVLDRHYKKAVQTTERQYAIAERAIAAEARKMMAEKQANIAPGNPQITAQPAPSDDDASGGA